MKHSITKNRSNREKTRKSTRQMEKMNEEYIQENMFRKIEEKVIEIDKILGIHDCGMRRKKRGSRLKTPQ